MKTHFHYTLQGGQNSAGNDLLKTAASCEAAVFICSILTKSTYIGGFKLAKGLVAATARSQPRKSQQAQRCSSRLGNSSSLCDSNK